jgi:hypothetical protein
MLINSSQYYFPAYSERYKGSETHAARESKITPPRTIAAFSATNYEY